MQVNKGLPKISIITPSFNQGRYIEDTIISVIGQGYPNLEYIIIDGGSTDETVEIIKKYEKHLAYWVSEKDNGQSNAINKGFNIATGDILGWLNSDDLYLPSTLHTIAKELEKESKCICFGNAIHFREEGEELISYGSKVPYYHVNSKLTNIDYIIQPSSFWRRSAWETIGNLREDLHYAFDYEWFLRGQNAGVRFLPISGCLSMYRLHKLHKSGIGGLKRQEELLYIYGLYSVHIQTLYKNLMIENLNLYTFRNKWLIQILKRLHRPHSFGDIVKLIKPKRYSNFNAKEINELLLML